ncbi:MAG: hypothetical protein PUC37_11540 [Spirochaetales bacterium]|nr:hypothetical protein [Spirochaetales bacterium]
MKKKKIKFKAGNLRIINRQEPLQMQLQAPFKVILFNLLVIIS